MKFLLLVVFILAGCASAERGKYMLINGKWVFVKSESAAERAETKHKVDDMLTTVKNMEFPPTK